MTGRVDVSPANWLVSVLVFSNMKPLGKKATTMGVQH